MFSGPKARYPSSASRKNRQPPLPSGLHPLIPPKTRMSQVMPTAQRRSYGFLTRNFLTIPITSATIIPPASLRSDYLIGIRRNADRLPSGTLIDFPRIRTDFCPDGFPAEYRLHHANLPLLTQTGTVAGSLQNQQVRIRNFRRSRAPESAHLVCFLLFTLQHPFRGDVS